MKRRLREVVAILRGPPRTSAWVLPLTLAVMGGFIVAGAWPRAVMTASALLAAWVTLKVRAKIRAE